MRLTPPLLRPGISDKRRKSVPDGCSAVLLPASSDDRGSADDANQKDDCIGGKIIDNF